MHLHHYVRSRLHRRLFLWFGFSILLTGIVVAGVLHLVTGTKGWEDWERLRAFTGNTFAEVWQRPAERDALAHRLSRELLLDVTLEDPSGTVLVTAGERCGRPEFTVPVMQGPTRLGTAQICASRTRPRQPWRAALFLILTGGTLWLASGALARRLSRPLRELASVARELGEGNLSARSRVGRWHHAPDEVARLAESFNVMAGRIERQISDQKLLLAAVSHELRTPLARMRVLFELLRGQGGEARTIDQMEQEVLEIDALVGELLASSRLDFEQLKLHPLDGKALASQALERAGLPPELLQVQIATASLTADATLMGRALANLLENARRHGGGAEALILAERDGKLAFMVEDKGPGFAPEEAERIFEPFYRRDHRDAREAGSLGLGLALVQRIAKAHRGEAFAENRPEGGARIGFTVR